MNWLLLLFSLWFAGQELPQWNDCCWKESRSGLSFKLIEKGQGKKPKPGESAQIHWVRYDVDSGQVIESTLDRGAGMEWTVGQEQFVPGFEEGLSKLKPGGAIFIKIPPQLAYGNEGLEGHTTFAYYLTMSPEADN